MGMKCYFVVLRNSLFWISLYRGLTIYCFPMLWKYWGIYRGDLCQGGLLWCWTLAMSEKKKTITWLYTSPLSPSRRLEFPLLCTHAAHAFSRVSRLMRCSKKIRVAEHSFHSCSVGKGQRLLSLVGDVEQVIADDIVLVWTKGFLHNEIFVAQLRTKKKNEKSQDRVPDPLHLPQETGLCLFLKNISATNLYRLCWLPRISIGTA